MRCRRDIKEMLMRMIGMPLPSFFFFILWREWCPHPAILRAYSWLGAHGSLLIVLRVTTYGRDQTGVRYVSEKCL